MQNTGGKTRIARLAIELFTLLVMAGTLIAIAWATCIAQSDYAARTRPYLAIENVAIHMENDSSVYLAIDIMNYGQVPATNVELGRIYMEAGLKGTGTDIVYIWIMDTRDVVVFPGKPFRTDISVDKTDYEEVILKGKVLTIRLTYFCGKRDYWYEATATLESDGTWRIGPERMN